MKGLFPSLCLLLFIPITLFFTGMDRDRFLSEYIAEKDSDWDWQLTFYEVSRKTIEEFHEFPFWSPYTRGGIPFLANLESPFLYPFFFPILLIGTSKGINLLILLNIVVGLIGTFLLSLELGLGIFSFIPPIIFIFSSIYHEFFQVGHIMYSGMALLPIVLLFYEKGGERIYVLPFASLFTTFILFMGAHYIFIYALMMTLLYSLFISINGKRWQLAAIAPLAVNALCVGVRDIISTPFQNLLILSFLLFLFLLPRRWNDLKSEVVRFGIYALLTFLLSSIKILPATYLFGMSERLVEIYSTEAGSPVTLKSLLLRWGEGIELGAGHEDHGTFFSFFPIFLLIGILFLKGSRERGMLFIFLFILDLSLSSNLPINMTRIIHKLPILSMIRVNERYFMLYSLFLALLAGIGAKNLLYLRLGRMGWISNMAILVFITLSFASYLSKLPDKISSYYSLLVQPERRGEVSEEFFQEKGGHSNFESVKKNRGRPDCTTTAPLRISPFIKSRGDPGYRGEAYLLSEKRLENIRITPNTVTIERRDMEEDILILNQNWFKGWKAEDGEGNTLEVYPWKGMPAVIVPAGASTVRMRYIPPRFKTGLFLTICGMMLMVVLCQKR